MKYLFTVLITATGFLCHSCRPGQGQTDPLTFFPEPISLLGVPVSEFTEWDILSPFGLVKRQNRWITGYRNSKTNLSLVDPVSGQRKDMVPRGTEPGEAVYLSSLGPHNDRTIQALNFNEGRLLLCDPEKALQDSAYRPEERILPTGVLHLTAASTDSFLIATGHYKEGRYLYYSFSDSSYRYLLSYPDFPAQPDLRSEIRQTLYASSAVSIRPDGKAFACTDMRCGILDLCRIDSGRIERIKEIAYYYPKVRIDEKGKTPVAYSRDNKYGFADVKTTDRYVYVLYSGRNYRTDQQRMYECPYVLVFDWEGNPVKAFHLDTPLTCIYYEEKEDALYGIGYNPDPVLMRYPMSESQTGKI